MIGVTFEESCDDGVAGCEVAVRDDDVAFLSALFVGLEVLVVGSADFVGAACVKGGVPRWWSYLLRKISAW
jgi:hypothetical protein